MPVSFALLLMGSEHGDYRHWNVSDGVYLHRVLGARWLSQGPTIYREEEVLVYPDRVQEMVMLAVWVVEDEVSKVAVSVLSARGALVCRPGQLFESLS
jgi:hypothetical protein